MKLVVQREYEINHCSKCPYGHACGRFDSREAEDWHCAATSDYKTIATYVEWNDQLPKVPPEWCPLRTRTEPVKVQGNDSLPALK